MTWVSRPDDRGARGARILEREEGLGLPKDAGRPARNGLPLSVKWFPSELTPPAVGWRQRAPGRGVRRRSLTVTKQVQQLDRVIIRFAGDSGDGMQLTGDRFTQETAVFGNDLSTLPNFPAEIRAPAGTLPGVSSFQVHFADHDILTPGDAPNVLVAMNPAALRANLRDLPRGADLIVNTDEFTKRNLTKVGLCGQSARGRLAGRLQPARHADHLDDGQGAGGLRRHA